MKLTEMIISAILKKGIFADFNHFVTDITLPDTDIKCHIQIERMTITVMKEEEEK